jgi:hypothetical protein
MCSGSQAARQQREPLCKQKFKLSRAKKDFKRSEPTNEVQMKLSIVYWSVLMSFIH